MPVELEETLDRIFLILRTLYVKGSMNQSALARETGINYNTIRNIVEALEVRGLVTKVRDPGPPGQTLVALTDTGKCFVACLSKPRG